MAPNNGWVQSAEYVSQYVTAGSSILLSPYVSPDPPVDLDKLAKLMWEKIFDVKVIIPRPYCHSHNIITNPTCVQCGGPMGVK